MERRVLVITEKPDAAKRIADALDADGKPRRMAEKGVPFYAARREGEIVIVPALGHLYTVGSRKKDRTSFPVFQYEWIPLYEAEPKKKRVRAWISVISKLAKKADTFIDACDYDIEGSIIGYNVLRFACNGKEGSARRMKYSILTKNEIEKAYIDPLPNLEFNIVQAGLARHEVDWLYGINLSRALTDAARKAGRARSVISTGRVQGPTLKFLAKREKSILGFVPTPFWSLNTLVELEGSTLEIEHEKSRFEKKEEAERVARECNGKTGAVTRIEESQFKLAPPPPFDLGSLQREAYRLFKYTPIQTGKIAQRLYLGALISYPRTGSQKLPQAIGYYEILNSLAKTSEHKECAEKLLALPKLNPKEGKETDAGHPAIYPTGNIPERNVGKAERNIWNLVVRRFMAAFGESAITTRTTATIGIGEHRFYAKGMRIAYEGWMQYYRSFLHPAAKILPSMNEGETARVKRIRTEERFNTPPPRYNPSTVIKKMESDGIGTKVTRAGVIQALYDREFIRGRNIEVTDLGLQVAEVLTTNCPTTTSPQLTRMLDEKMTQIQQGTTAKENVIEETIETLNTIMESLKTNEERIGKQLLETSMPWFENKTLCSCPTCKTGKLLVVTSKKTGKRFLGCTKYFEGECQTSFPIPQKGSIKPSARCHSCGWPTIRIQAKGKRPWRLCFNPQCKGMERYEPK